MASQLCRWPHIFTIKFSGNGFTSPERAADFALLRAAETTLENGFAFFEVTEYSDSSKITIHRSPVTATTKSSSSATAAAFGGGNSASFSGNKQTKTTTEFSGGNESEIERPRSFRTIKCYKTKPKNNDAVFNAQELQRSLRLKYKI